MPDIFSRTHLLFIDKRDRQLGLFLPGRAITCCIVFAYKLTLRLWGFWFRCILLGANIQPPVVAIREKNLEYIVHKYWQISLGVEKMPAVGIPTSSALHGVGRSPSEVCHCGSKESRPKYLPYTLQLPLSLLAEIRLLGLQLGFQLSLIPQATVHYCPPLSCIHWEEEQLLLAKTSSARLWGGNSLSTHTSPPRRLVALFPWRKVKPGEKLWLVFIKRDQSKPIRRLEIFKHGELIGTINAAEFRENTRTLLTLDTPLQYFLLLLFPAYSLL